MKYNRYDSAKVDLVTVCMKGFVLGIVCSVSICGMVVSVLTSSYDSVFKASIYVFCIALFHLLEFLSTALYNNSETDDDSFILTDQDLMLANAATLAEYAVKRQFFGDDSVISALGLAMVVVAQLFRTAAMITAGDSFNHYIQREHKASHKLVTSGVYSVVRHPSYFGFFWWVVGLRLWLNTYATLILGVYKLWRFFNIRINYEELYLVHFFGDDYLNAHTVAIDITVHHNTVVSVNVATPSSTLPQRHKHVLVGETVVLTHNLADGSRGLSGVVKWNSRAVVVQNVGLDDVVEQEGADKSEISINGGRSTSGEVPAFRNIVRHRRVRVLQEGDKHKPVVDENPWNNPVDHKVEPTKAFVPIVEDQTLHDKTNVGQHNVPVCSSGVEQHRVRVEVVLAPGAVLL